MRLPVEREGRLRFVHAETGAICSAQEVLFHYFGLSLEVIVEPSEWYAYYRKPTLAAASPDRSRVLVRFGAMSASGEGFGGTCLYACRDLHSADLSAHFGVISRRVSGLSVVAALRRR